MCGRYSLTTPVEAVRQVFDFPERPNLAPRANIAPSQDVAAVRLASGGPFALAGLWERWTGRPGGEGQGGEAQGGEAQGGEAVESCTIVTTEANARLREIHPRMPVILAPDAFDPWLDPQTPGAQAEALLAPFPAEALTHYRVSPRLNSPANDDPALIEPLDAPAEAGDQPRLL